MAKYSDFQYGGAQYGETALVDFSASPVEATALNYAGDGGTTTVVKVTWKEPYNGTDPEAPNYVKLRLVRNQDAIPETAEDGVAVWSWVYDADSTTNPILTELNDGWDFYDVPLAAGRYVYYRMWIQLAADNTWVSGGETYTIIPKSHGTGTNQNTHNATIDTLNNYQGEGLLDREFPEQKLLTTHDKFMDLLPRVFTSSARSPLDSVDTNSFIYNFLKGFSFMTDELLTYSDLLIPEASGIFQNPNLLKVQADQLGLDTAQVSVSKSYKKLIREAIYIYSRKGTLASLNTLAEAVTGYAPTVTLSPNLMLTNQDSTFNKGLGSWTVVGNATLSLENTILPPFGSEPAAIDRNYTAKVVVAASGAKIENGVSDPVRYGIPVMPETSYKVTWYTQASATSKTATLSVLWYDYKGSLLRTDVDGSPFSSTSTAFEKHSLALSASPAEAAYAALSLSFGHAATYYLDMFQFAAGTYDFKEARGINILLNPSKLNYIKNPSFENSTHGISWSFSNLTPSYVSTTLKYVPDGGTMAQVEATSSNATMSTTSSVVVPNQYYTLSSYFSVQTGTTAQVKLTLTAKESVTENVLATKTVTSNLTTAWSRSQATMYVPAAITSNNDVVITAVLTVVASGKVINVDGVQLEPTYVATDYFDGALPVSTGASWLGDAHNSTSCLYPNRQTKIPQLVLAVYNNLPQNTPFSIDTYGFDSVTDITY